MTLVPKVKYVLPAVVAVALLVHEVPVARARQAAAPAAGDSASIAAAVTQLQQKYQAALEANNTAVLDSLVASDAWMIRPNGERHNKADWLATMAGKFKLTKSSATKTAVHVHGNDVAIVVMDHKGAGTLHTGDPMPGAVTITTIWVMRDGNWQVVLRSTTPKTGGAK